MVILTRAGQNLAVSEHRADNGGNTIWAYPGLRKGIMAKDYLFWELCLVFQNNTTIMHLDKPGFGFPSSTGIVVKHQQQIPWQIWILAPSSAVIEEVV
jgi:hypothetical protein